MTGMPHRSSGLDVSGIGREMSARAPLPREKHVR
jgi:hypothetical protein